VNLRGPKSESVENLLAARLFQSLFLSAPGWAWGVALTVCVLLHW
jgi:hypothetical protein